LREDFTPPSNCVNSDEIVLILVSEIEEAGASLLVRGSMIASHKTKGTKQLKETII
jgi:hypothetical protein